MKSSTHKIKTIAVLWFRLYLHVKLDKQNIILFNWKHCSSLPRAEQSRRTEREQETEREREVCAHCDSKTSHGSPAILRN